MLKFLRRFFQRKERPLTHALSIHLSAKPDADECATALRLLFIVAGPSVFQEACDELPNIPGLSDVAENRPSLDEAGFGQQPTGTAPKAPAAPPAPGPVTLDTKGLPWDERIHSSSKKQNADGSWKRRGKIEDSLVTSVTAELRNTYPAPAPKAPAAPAAPAAPQAPAAPPAPPAGPETPTDFASFMRLSGAFFAGGKLTMADVNALTMDLTQSPSPIELKKRDDAAMWWPVLWEAVKDKVAGK